MGRRGREGQNYRFCCGISKDEVNDALKKRKNGKAVGPDGIPVEISKHLGGRRHRVVNGTFQCYSKVCQDAPGMENKCNYPAI